MLHDTLRISLQSAEGSASLTITHCIHVLGDPAHTMFTGFKKPSFGVHNPSPIKKRNKRKTNTYVTPPLQDARRMVLLNRLKELRGGHNESETLDGEIEELDDIQQDAVEDMEIDMFDSVAEFGKVVK